MRFITVICLLTGAASAQNSDVTPPTLVSLSFSASSFDTTNANATFTVTARITDDLSGFTRVVGSSFRHSSGQGASCIFSAQSGTPLDGIWVCDVTIPQYSAAGSWGFNLTLRDITGNTTTLTPAQLAATGFPSTVNVVSNPDTAPPNVTSIQFTPLTVDVSTADQTVTVELGLADNLSGAFYSNTSSLTQFVLSSPGGEQKRYVFHNQWTRISGTAQNGVWRAIFPMPRHSAPGLWFLERASIADRVGNAIAINRSLLVGAGLNPTFAVTSATPDVTAPTLTTYSYSPTFINTAAAIQLVPFQLGLQDAGTGVSFEATNGTGASDYYGMWVTSPSSQQQAYFNTLPFASLSSGTPLSGVWNGTVSFAQFSEAGTWRIERLELRDRVLNRRTYTTAQLQALGLPTTIQVIRPSGGVDGTIGAAGGTVQDATFGARAQLTIPSGALPANTQVSIDVLSSPVNVPTPQGYRTAESPYVNIDLNPHPAGLVADPGLTLTIPLNSSLIPGTVLTLLRINPGSATLVPATSVTGGTVTGPVSADGLNVTFSGIASLSTVVAMRAGEALAGDLNSDGVVDCADIAIVRASYGKRSGQAGFDVRADVTGDGVVNVNDLAYVSRRLPAGLVCP